MTGQAYKYKEGYRIGLCKYVLNRSLPGLKWKGGSEIII